MWLLYINLVLCCLGFGLAFIAYPEAILNLPFPPIWSILFFLMLITLGLDSQFTGLEAILTAAMDMFPRQLRSRRSIFTLSACIFCFLLAIPCITQVNNYITFNRNLYLFQRN